MGPRAQSLVLDLLSAAGGRPIPVRALVRAAEIFGLTENNLRVALARLVSDGKLVRSERGLYSLAPAALPVQQRVTSWSRIDERRVSWRGGWVAVHTSPSRGRRGAARRRRERALTFLGMRELSPGLHVRPDNLKGGTGAVREELLSLGLAPDAVVFAMNALDSATERRARALWDGDALERGYRETCRRLRESTGRLADMPLPEAMVECFVLGGHAIRQLVYDPLLPEPIVRAALRRELIEEMRRYDRAGREVWRRFMRAQGAPALESLLSFRQVGRAA